MGGVTWFLARAGARRRLWSGLGLVVLVGLTGTVVLASWAGARRTATTYERLTHEVNHADFTVATEGDPAAFDPTIAIDGPGVAQASIINGYAMARLTDDGLVDLESEHALIVPTDTIGFHDIDRPVMVEGRAPDPDAPDEIVVPEEMRDQGYTVGSAVDTCVVDFAEAIDFGRGALDGTASVEAQREFAETVCLQMTLHVVGVTGPGPAEVVLREDTESESFPVAGPAFTRVPGVVSGFSFVLVDMEDGADAGAYVDHVLDGTPPDAGVSLSSSAVRTTTVERALDPYVRALTLFAVAVALAGLGVAGPAMARWAGTPGGDRATLRAAMGVRPHQLRLASAARGAVVALAAGIVAMGAAAALSDQFPRGIGARIEPDPGHRIDGFVLGVGFLVILASGAVLGALAPTRDRAHVRRPSRVAEVMQSLGLSPGPVAGVRSALAGDGRGAGILPTIAGVALALVAVISSLTYQAGLDRLLEEPERYGWTWDEVLDESDSGITPELVDAVSSAPDVAGVSVGYRSSVVRDGAAVLFAFDPGTGDPYPTILEGRRPTGADEIALGGQTLDRLHLSIGDDAEFRGPQGEAVELTVVGRTLLPLLSLGDDLSVGEGGLVDVALVEHFGVNDPGIALVDLRDGASDAAVQAILESAGDPHIGGVFASGPVLTADLRSYDAVRRTPLALATALSLLGLGVLAHTVATSVRRRRLALAVLRSLGFARGDLRASVRWSVLTLVGTCVLIAVPLGIAAGRTLWDSFASGLGVDSAAVTPVGPILGVVLLAFAAGILFSVIPARQATRLRAADVLRTE